MNPPCVRRAGMGRGVRCHRWDAGGMCRAPATSARPNHHPRGSSTALQPPTTPGGTEPGGLRGAGLRFALFASLGFLHLSVCAPVLFASFGFLLLFFLHLFSFCLFFIFVVLPNFFFLIFASLSLYFLNFFCFLFSPSFTSFFFLCLHPYFFLFPSFLPFLPLIVFFPPFPLSLLSLSPFPSHSLPTNHRTEHPDPVRAPRSAPIGAAPHRHLHTARLRDPHRAPRHPQLSPFPITSHSPLIPALTDRRRRSAATRRGTARR